jgi:hypothetical protein
MVLFSASYPASSLENQLLERCRDLDIFTVVGHGGACSNKASTTSFFNFHGKKEENIAAIEAK